MVAPAQHEEPIAMRHLRLWLAALDRTLAAAVEHQGGVARALATRALSAHAITPDHAAALCEQASRFSSAGYPLLPPIALDPAQRDAEATAFAQSGALPLLQLEREAGLSACERAALLVVVAAELSPTHERLYGYLVDDLSRAQASVDVVLLLTSGCESSESLRRAMLGPAGRLRRLGLLLASDSASTARTTLKVAPLVLDWLTGACAAPPLRLHDPDELVHPEHGPLPSGAETELALTLLRQGRGVVGVWGDGDRAGLGEALAARAGRPLRRLSCNHLATLEASLEAELALAAGSDAIAWLDLEGPSSERSARELAFAHALSGRAQPIILSAREPFRPAALLRNGAYAELMPVAHDSQMASDDLRVRTGIDAATAATLTGRYRFNAGQRRTLASLMRVRAERGREGLELAARLAAASASSRHAFLVEPRRGPEDLVLPAALHRQVLELASFFVAAPAADEQWGFGRLGAAPGALKALFTGDPGTGKTLAAEVVARQLGRPLLKVDLAQVVSKWVGETEKNLEELFDVAEDAAAVLFFDEADTLFGKRGEVRHGTDRYANLEVGYLLQRLETYRGLAILASNLRDEIDPAFVRRFQVLLHFPRPTEFERRRIWQLALAHADGTPADLDWDALLRLDLTGAGIVGCARLAVLLAVGEGQQRPCMEHVREAIARQYRQEARLLRGGAQPVASPRLGVRP